MKAVLCLAITFVVSIYALPDCSSRWERWQQCPGTPQLFPQGKMLCFIDGAQDFVLMLSSLNSLALNCHHQPPDSELTDCLNVTGLYGIGMRNCQFLNFSLKDYLREKYTAYIVLIYDKYDISESLIPVDLVISNIPLLKNITIFGLRSTGLLNITFGTLPDIYLLNITNHNFTRFHKQPFATLYHLRGLSLRFGIIEMIPEDLFRGLGNLRLLDLAWNRIKKFDLTTFKPLTLLTDLDLQENDIEHLPSHLFSDLKNLATLHVQNNKLTTLPSDLFQYIPSLVILQITGNAFGEGLPDGFLKGAFRLQKFLAMNCSLAAVRERFFFEARYLTFIALSANQIKVLPPGLFNNTENLSHLFLDVNEIGHLPSRVFNPLFRLFLLSITYNKLYSLDRNCFAGLSSLSYLDLSNNKLSNIDESTFDPLMNLQELKIANNPLITLPSQFPFGQSKYLLKVVASNCQLQQMPNVDWMLGNLTFLDFSYNVITNVTLPIFTRNRTQVMLSNNKITSIRLNFDKKSNVSPFYFLQNNPIRCNCNLQEFLQFLHSDLQRNTLLFADFIGLNCFGSNNEFLINIWPPYKVCPLESKSCPPECHCYETTQRKVVIECSNKEMVTAPDVLPLQTAEVYFQNNNITELPKNNTDSWKNIEALFLSNNSLESLEGWQVPQKLKLLAVDGNLLSNLPSILMERIDSTPDFQIYLSGNSWQCDCQSVAFKKWFDRNRRKIQDLNSTFCTRQSQENGQKTQSLIADTPIDLFCVEKMASPTWQPATITIGVLVFLFICLAIVYYRYQNTILSLLYSRNIYCFWWDRRDLDEDKLFDAFLCYSSADRDIMIDLMKELEPSYKLCIHERDWLPGYAISHHIVNSVQNSRKTLLLLSKDFLESIWFQVEFRTAYTQMLEDRVHRLVLIIIGDIGDVSNLEEELRHLLATKTYLKWGEKWFWEKLRYALRRSTKQVEKI